MKHIIIGAVLLGLTATAPALANDGFMGVSWAVGIPTGDTKDFTGSTSFRGIGFEGRWMQDDSKSLGFYLGWQVFNKKELETAQLLDVEDGGGDVTGTQFRFLNAFPLLVTGHYHFGENRSRTSRPYVGLGAGAIVAERRVEIGVYAFQETQWHLGLAPEVGIHIPLGWETRGFASVKYFFAFKAGDKTESWVGFNLGLASF